MSVSRSRRSAGERSIARESKAAGQRIRKGLLCSTALVAASLAASGAMAQTASGGGAVTDQTGSNGGYLASGPTGVTVTNVTINNTTGSPTVDAIRFTSSTFAGSGRGFQFTGTNVLTAAPGGSAINYIGTGGENTGFGVAGSLTATGLNGWLAVNNGAIFHGGAGTINMIAQTNGSGAGLDWTSNNSCICDVSFSGSFSASNFQYGANLTAAAGVNFATGAGGSITGVQTGIRAITTTGNVDLSIGSSISASSTGISATSNGGAANVTATGAIVAPNGIVATGANGATVTTSGDGTIDSTAAGSGTGILATSSGGSNAVTVNVGAAIGGATAFARGVDVSTTGTSTGAINITTTAAIIAASRGISATAGTFGNTGTINVGGDVTGATGIYSNVGNYAVNVGAGVTVTSTGAGAANAALYLVNGTNTVTNNGALVASGTGSAGVYFSSNGLTTNTATGTITGSTGVYYQNSASLTNAGAITGTGVAASDAGVRSLGGTYNNTGTITGNTGMLNSGNLFTVNNTGAGATITGALNAINVSGGWLNLTNTGTIQTAGGTGGAGLAGVYINSAVTLYNQQITNSGSISGGSDATNGFGVNVVDGVLVLTNQSGGTIAGGIGAISIATNDAATIDLQAGSTTTGDVVLSSTGARTVTIAGAFNGNLNATGNSGVVNLTVNTSATGYGLLRGGTGADSLTFTGTGSRTLNVDNLDSWNTGAFTGGAWTLSGTGNATSFGSGLSISGGSTVTIGNTLQLQGATGLSMTTGGSLMASASLTNTRTLTLTGAGGLGAASGQTLTQSGLISGSGSLSIGGLGTTILSGANTYTGGTIVNSGILQLGTTTAAGTGTIRMIDPQINFAATGTYANAISLEVADGQQAADPTILNNISGGNITLTGRIFETAGVGGANQYVTFAGGNTIFLTNGTNAWGGVTTVNSGVTISGTTGSISGGSIVNNGTLIYTNVSAGTATQNISGSGGIQVTGTGVTLNGNITTAGQVQVNGAGASLTLGGTRSGGATTGVLVSGAGATLTVADGGAIQSGQYNGVRVTGVGATVNNLGTIQNVGTGADGAVGAGVYVQNAGAGGVTTVNNGSVTDTGAGSLIFGRNAGVRHEAGSTDTLVVNNYGHIVGELYNGIENTAGGLTVNNFNGGYIYTLLGNGVSSNSVSAISVTNAGVIGQNVGGSQIVGGNGVVANGALTLINQAGGLIIGQQSGVTANSTLSGSNAGTITSNGTTAGTAGIVTAAGGSFTNQAGGQITGAIGVRSTGGTLALTNFGIVTGANAGLAGVNASGAGSVITNHGTIQGGAQAILLNNGGTVHNLGTSSVLGTTNTAALTDASGIYSNGALTLTNQGTVSTASTGVSHGVQVLGVATITNTGTITAASASGIAFTGGGSSIVNSGTITGGNSATFGYGVQNSAASGLSTITNQSGGVIGGGTGSILLNGAGNTDINLQAGSTTNGQILSTAGGTHNVTIAGVLNGAYNAATGSGVDNITLAATGSMTSANLGAGNDTFLYQGGTFSGLIDGGSHTGAGDLFRSVLGAGSASISLNNLTNFEIYNQESGTLTLTGSRSGGAGWHLLGGTLTLNGSLTNTGVNGLGVQTAGITVLGANTTVNVGAGSVLWANTQNAIQGDFVENITVNNSGTIGGGTNGGAGVRLNRSAVINNNAGGLITSSANNAGAMGISNSGAGVVVNNASGATITGNYAGIDNVFGIEASAPGLVVNNSGSITSFGAGSAAIRSNSGTLGVVNNSGGTISSFVGLSITGGSATINNAGAITGTTGSGVTSAGALVLTNSGTITGAAFGLNLSGGGTITNQSGGSITGTTGAINLTGASNYTLNLEAGSTTGAITSTATGSNQVFLRGTLNGGYTGGTGVDTFTLASTGSMTSANLGAGNDTFTWQGGAFSGLVDGGTGTDSFISNLSGGTGSLNLANIAAFESIIHQSGNVTLTGASASAAAEIHAGQGGPSGTLIFNGTTGLTGDIFVNGAVLRAETAGAFGTGAIHLINPTVVYGATGTYANNILLEVQSPATADPSTLRTDAGVTATLSGSITQGTGAGVDPIQPLVIDGSGRIVLTNTANLWAGTTTINAGATLQGATDTISGSNTIANGVLHLLQPTSGAFAQNVSGGGNVQISGLNAGQTLTLSGALTNAFGVQVLDGSALAITGSVATTNGSSAVTLNSTNLAGVTNQLNNSGSISGVFAINAVRNLDLTNSGTISASITNFNNSGIYVGGTGTISNSGSITSGTNAIYTQGVGSVTNTGLIRGGGAASTIRLFGANSSVTNLAGGQITTTGTGVGVYLDGINASVINAGAISGGNAISLVSGGAIINTGTLTSTNGSGVVFQAAGSIDNQAFGSITGATNGVTYTAGSAAVTNAGSIAGSNGSGLRLLGGGTVTNAASGQITGTGNAAIFVQGGALNLVSQGSLVGTAGFAIVTTGAFNNVIDLQAGSSTNGSVTTDTGADALTVAGMLTGAVDLGAGNDTFTLVSGGSVTGLIDGGAGTDAFVLAGSGDAGFNVAQAVNFETRAMNGTGTWTLTGTDVSTAGWALNSGVLALSGGSAINDATGVTIAVAGTLALLTDEAIGSLAGSGFVNLGASRLTLAAAQTTAYAGVISGAGGLTVGSPNNLTLSGANTYTGTTIVDGVLTLGAAGVLADSSNLLINTAGTFDLQGFDETVNNAVINGVLNGTGTLTAAQYQLTGATVNANLGAGDLIQVSGVSALNGTSGAQLVSIAGGTLGLGASDRLSDTATVVVANGATLDLNAFNDTVGLLGLAGTLNGTGTLSASQYQLTGATANANLGAGDLIQISGLSTLNGTSGSQLVSIAGGTLGLGASDRLSDTATVVVANGATLDLNAFNDTVGLLGLAGTLNGTGTLTAGQYQLDGATVNANLGAGTLFNLGGVSTLNGTSGAGNIVVQAGTLALGASDRLSDTATLVVANGATLDLNAFNDTVNLALLNGTLAGTGTLTADQYQLTGATVNANLGAGTLFNLGGVSTLNGTAGAADVLLNAGTLRLGASGRLSDTATVSVATGATFALNGFDERIGALFGTGDVNVGAGRLTFGGIDSGFGGRLSGAGTLVHTGGLFTLMGDHTIASISNTGGELRFLGTTTGGIAVTGGSLTGAGTIGGALTASNGAILSPGVAGVQNGVGGFVAGGLTLNGATLAIDALGRSGGNLSDQLRINGTATLTGGLLAPTFQGGAADFDFSTRYLFLQANNLVGTFANGAGFTAADQEGLFWRVRYDLTANGAVLELRELTNFDPGATGTGNQRAVGRALSGGQLEASDDFAGILSLFASLNDADRAAAFESISGEPLAGMTTSLFGANGSFLTAMRDGGLSDRDGGGALGFVGRMTLSGGRETVADRVGAVMSAFDPSASTARGAGGWVAAYGADQTLEGKPGTADVDSRLNGFAGGYGVRNGAMGIGAAAGVTRLEGEVVDRQARYESDLTHAAAYAAFDDGVWAADVTVSIYGGGLDSRRGIQVGAFHGLAIGDTRAEGQSISASVARRFQLSQDTMIALGANGTASSASIDGFTEIGAGGLSLQASGLERDWQTLQISARGTQDYHVDGRRLRVYAGAGVMATTGDREATGDMRFSGAPTGFGAFTVEGAETPPVAGLADFGLEVGLREGLTLSAGYRGLYSERLRDNQVGIKLRANW
jgi:hypothetical protein